MQVGLRAHATSVSSEQPDIAHSSLHNSDDDDNNDDDGGGGGVDCDGDHDEDHNGQHSDQRWQTESDSDDFGVNDDRKDNVDQS